MDWSMLVAASAVVGVIVVIIRNGKSSAKSYGELEQRVADIKETLQDEHSGLGALNNKVTEMQSGYAATLASHGQKIKNLEGEVFTKKKRRSKVNGEGQDCR